ncbi:uncharacterized protein LOC105429856 [Pogonomyrmex barbatus]|uniref:Uncharacterized protein LOC105429856 n=1 Tax=Pogonomyrmex barbatus TaxID=144034 RepID=A0A6I9WP67_9HYME|nr:uncharacterized protein LOC105429856 [Pogonomyrmex barbatus]
MEFSGGAVFLPYINVCDQEIRRENIHKMRKVSIDLIDSLQIKNGIILNSPEETNCVIYHLFYGGMWQPPLLNMYTKHNFLYDIFLANVTNSDIVKCYESAEKGFEIWSAKSIKSRIEILSNLESMLISIGKPLLAAIVERWMSFPNVCPNVIGFSSACASSQYAEVEVMYTRMPLGVIFLKECNENALFVRLMQTLIAGNTVIVLNNANFSGILPYCNIFSTCGIPAGVINSLSHSDLNFLENKLFAGPHSDYIKDYFEKGTSVQSYAISYRNLTMPKQIVLPFK